MLVKCSKSVIQFYHKFALPHQPFSSCLGVKIPIDCLFVCIGLENFAEGGMSSIFVRLCSFSAHWSLLQIGQLPKLPRLTHISNFWYKSTSKLGQIFVKNRQNLYCFLDNCLLELPWLAHISNISGTNISLFQLWQILVTI